MHALEVMKEVGKLWQSLSAQDRQKYDLMSDEDKLRFQSEMKDFNKAVEHMQSGCKDT